MYLGSKVVPVSDYVLSEEGIQAGNKIWDETVETLCAVDPRVRRIVDDYLTAEA